MRKVVLLFATIILASVVRSQTMTINLKNGDIVKYNMDDVESLVFSEENDNKEESSIVGVWECISFNHSEGLFEDHTLNAGDFLYMNADNTYLLVKKDTETEIDKGKWSLRGNDLIITSDDPSTILGTFTILQLDSSVFSFTWLGFVTVSFRRVTN